MEKIRKLEKKLMEIQENPIALEFENLNKQLIEKQKELNAIRDRLKDALKEKKKIREQMQKLIKELDELRAKFNEIDAKFKQLKEEYARVNEELQKKLEMFALEVSTSTPVSMLESMDIEEIKEKIKQIDEKLLRGEPITTEELLLLQQFESLVK